MFRVRRRRGGKNINKTQGKEVAHTGEAQDAESCQFTPRTESAP